MKKAHSELEMLEPHPVRTEEFKFRSAETLVTKPVINSNYSRKVFPPNEQNTEKSLTKPNQVLGIQQIMARIESGQLIPRRDGFYTEEELPITASPMDYTDLDNLNNNGQSLARSLEQIKFKKESEKAAARKKEQDEFNAWKASQSRSSDNLS